MRQITLGSANILKTTNLIEISSDFNFTLASLFLRNVPVKPISAHSREGEARCGHTPPGSDSPEFRKARNFDFQMMSERGKARRD